MKPATPQLAIFLSPDGSIHVEAPGNNGSRRKVDITPGFEWQDIARELQDQQEKIREKERNDLLALQNQNIKYVTKHHPGIVHRVWNYGEAAFSHAWKARLHQEAEEGRPKSPSTQRRRTRSGPSEAMDLE